jgi:sulfur carrier protein ThiS adenylyltransferase
MLTVNEHPYPFQTGMRLGELATLLKPGADVLVRNGEPSSPDIILEDKDICSLIKQGEIPTPMEMEFNLKARHGAHTLKILRQSTVGIMGLGGLGSAVAISLVKIGIGKLIISDYDIVVLSNIHRQQYFIDQIGEKKTQALKKTLVRINPFVTVTTVDTRLSKESIPTIFANVDVLVECFDKPEMKATALRTAMTNMKGTRYIGSSGIAGFDSGNTIVSREIRPGVYIVGDNQSDSAAEGSLLATRVGIAAHHQAHQAVRMLLGLDK